MAASSDAALPEGTFANSADAINVILTQEANRIGNDIHKSTLHTSPWIDLVKQSTFPDGMGYTLNTLIYDRALPLKTGDLSGTGAVGVNWNDIRLSAVASGVTGFTDGQSRDTSSVTDEGKAKIDFTQVLKSYSLKKAVVESPKINVEDLRYAAHRTDQLRAIMDLLKESVRNSWEDRYRDEYARLAGNIIVCEATGSAINTEVNSIDFSGMELEASITSDGTAANIPDFGAIGDPAANISNAILDKAYFNLIRAGAGANAYGRENGRPVFSLVCSSEASYQLQTEAGFRDDVRYNNAKVGDLIAPLGVEKSFRGFYHLIDDLAPRYTLSNHALTRVNPYTLDTANNKIITNSAYDSAGFEVAFILVDNVMESLIPQPITGGGGVTFDPVNYKGDFKWTNIPDAAINPDGTIGFFRGIMASASKPIKTDFGFVILFQRDSSTPAA